uniref:Uncharacterized protein n=1 Tax=Lepeophtheirus salmonis TaxID=72036 RepID=A0A0K2VJL2_LEPSM
MLLFLTLLYWYFLFYFIILPCMGLRCFIDRLFSYFCNFPYVVFSSLIHMDEPQKHLYLDTHPN